MEIAAQQSAHDLMGFTREKDPWLNKMILHNY